MKKKIFLSFLFLAGSVLWLGCEPNLDDLSPRYAVPLVYGGVSAADIIDTIGEKQKIRTDADGLVTLVFNASTNTKTAEEVFVLPSLPLLLLPGVYTYPVPSVGGMRVYKVDCKGGFLRIRLQHPSANPLNVTVESPSIEKGSTPFSFSMQVAPVSGVVRLDTMVPLQGYVITMTQPVPTLTIHHSVVDATTSLPVVPASFSVAFDSVKFRYMEFSLAAAYTMENFSDTVPITIFDHIREGQFFARDPFLEIRVTNGMGAPVKLGFSNVIAYSAATGQGITFLSPLPTLSINMPPAPARGDTAYYEYRVDTTNSNLRDVLALLASEIRYTSIVTMLPTGGVAFVEDTSRVRLESKLHIPLYGYANMIMEKEFAASFTESIDGLDSLVLYIRFKNDFPLSVKGQLYLVDSQGVVFDSLFAQEVATLIAPATVRLDGTVVQRGESFLKIPLGHRRAAQLRRLAALRAKMILGLHNSSGATSEVKVYDTYRIDVQVSAEITPAR